MVDLIPGSHVFVYANTIEQASRWAACLLNAFYTNEELKGKSAIDPDILSSIIGKHKFKDVQVYNLAIAIMWTTSTRKLLTQLNDTLYSSRKYLYLSHKRDWNFLRGGGSKIATKIFKEMYQNVTGISRGVGKC